MPMGRVVVAFACLVAALVLMVAVSPVAAVAPSRGSGAVLDVHAELAVAVESTAITITSDQVGVDTGVLAYESTCFAVSGYPATPQVSWTAVSGAASYIVVFRQSPGVEEESIVFWWMYNVDASILSIAYNTSVGTEGVNALGVIGYDAPCAGGGGNRYFTLNVYALAAAPEDVSSTITYDEFFAIYAGGVIGQGSLSMTYNKETDGPSESSLLLAVPKSLVAVESTLMTITSDNVNAETGVLAYENTCFAVSGYPATPQVTWTAVSEAASYVVVFRQTPAASDISIVFWWMYNVDASILTIDYNTTIGTEGINALGEIGYAPPCAGGGGNRYFTLNVFALATAPDSVATNTTFDEFFSVYAGGVIGQGTLSMTYNKETDGPTTTSSDVSLRLKKKLRKH